MTCSKTKLLPPATIILTRTHQSNNWVLSPTKSTFYTELMAYTQRCWSKVSDTMRRTIIPKFSKNIISEGTTFAHIQQNFMQILWCSPMKGQSYGCSNVAKLFEKKHIFKKKICMIFSKNLFFSVKIFFFFFQIKLCIQNKYLHPLSKNLTLFKKFHFVKIFILFKQTHSV